MRIGVIHQFYLRPGQGGSSRFNEMARLWAEAGHEVWVVAGQVDYTSGARPARWRGRWCVEERDGGVRVLRAWTPDTYHRTFAGRALALGGFGLSATWAALRRLPPCDVLLASSPPLTAALPGLVARWARRAPLIFEVRDLWPASAVDTGVLGARSPITLALYGLEALAHRGADVSVALTPAIRADIAQRGLARPERLVEVPNGADARMIDAPFDPHARRARRAKLGWSGRFVVLYAGAHGLANDLGQLVEAAEPLRAREDIRLVAVGDGPHKAALVARTRRLGRTNLEWLDPVGRAEIPGLMDAADAGAAILQKNPTFRTVYPNKVFDTMARARPVVCGVDGAARELVVGAGAGVFARPEDPTHLAEQIAWLADHPARARQMGRRGRALVCERFDRRVLAGRYLEIFEGLVGRADRRS